MKKVFYFNLLVMVNISHLLRLHIIEDDNEKLRRQLDELKKVKKEKELKAKELENEPKTETKRDSRTIPGELFFVWSIFNP